MVIWAKCSVTTTELQWESQAVSDEDLSLSDNESQFKFSGQSNNYIEKNGAKMWSVPRLKDWN